MNAVASRKDRRTAERDWRAAPVVHTPRRALPVRRPTYPKVAIALALLNVLLIALDLKLIG